MKVYKKIMAVLAEIEKIVMSVDLVAVTLLTFLNVLFRKLGDWIPSFKLSIAWTEEVVINLFVLMIMLGCALCAKEGSLISLSLIYDRLKPGVEKQIIKKDDVLSLVKSRSFDVLIILGAGDLDNQVPQIAKILTEKSKKTKK